MLKFKTINFLDESAEVIGFNFILAGILLQLLVIHLLLDETIVGAVGILTILLLIIPIIFLSAKFHINRTISIYWSLFLLTTVLVWYMSTGLGIQSPSAIVALVIPSISYFFLGRRHFIIWTVIIISIYSLLQIFPLLFKIDIIPFPKVSPDNYSAEYWATSIVMINAFNMASYFLSSMKIKLEKIGRTDSLTQALNRGGINERIKDESEVFKRYGEPYSIAMIDADYFKKINDRYGHSIGDKVLVEITATIKKHLRPVDSLGRWGGEEFLILLSRTSVNSANIVAERVRAGIESASIKLPSKVGTVNFTVSIGVSSVEKSDKSPEDVIKRADDALYHAKETGRNKIHTIEG